MLEDLLGLSRTAFLLEPERPVAPEDAKQYQQMVARRVAGEPLQHILGYAEFCRLRIEVSPEVLIPRPETEEVVAHALERIATAEAPRILDVGTGSGCIALALKHERPDAAAAACDVSSEALAVARANGERLGLEVTWVEADVLAAPLPTQGLGGLDLLISNPPYIPNHEADTLPAVVREHDPAVALFAGDDPLRFYRALVQQALDCLAPKGWLVVEVHAEYGTEVADAFRRAELDAVAVHADWAGRPRIVSGRQPPR
jgi:release factor glutamine methyltransferase